MQKAKGTDAGTCSYWQAPGISARWQYVSAVAVTAASLASQRRVAASW